MRLQKVRSFLSAYCNGELAGRRLKAVEKHLTEEPLLRKEEKMFRDISKATDQLPKLKTSDGFNSRLLDKIARERFAETRHKAMLPPVRVPRFRRAVYAPVAVTAMLLFVVSYGLLSTSPDAGRFADAGSSQSDDYLTVQPATNPNMAVRLDPNWSLVSELQKARQASRVFSRLTANNGFAKTSMASSAHSGLRQNNCQPPYARSYYRVRPVRKVYQGTNALEAKESY
ncbi:MAG: hypothetical protein V3T31_04270 [candidate division Zixibacteria bacterium]